jgi:hypothetical protein
MTDRGEVSSFSIPHADPAKSAQAAESGMESMLALGILRLNNGIPTAAKSAAIVTTTLTNLM